jgi:hypothetical protein
MNAIKLKKGLFFEHTNNNSKEDTHTLSSIFNRNKTNKKGKRSPDKIRRRNV